MARKTGTTEYAVLGMLALGPGSGYDLKKRIEGSVAHFWSESYGQIYPILARLASRRLVERRLERQKGKPDRYVYSITAEGLERLGAWLAEPAREQPFRSELLREQRAHPELPYWLITLRFGQSRANALLRWSEQTLETLERLSRAPARRAKKG